MQIDICNTFCTAPLLNLCILFCKSKDTAVSAGSFKTLAGSFSLLHRALNLHWYVHVFAMLYAFIHMLLPLFCTYVNVHEFSNICNIFVYLNMHAYICVFIYAFTVVAYIVNRYEFILMLHICMYIYHIVSYSIYCHISFKKQYIHFFWILSFIIV